MKRIYYIASLLVTGLLFSCSKNDNSGFETAALSAKAKETVNTVHITSTGFNPVELNIPAGNEVVWMNDDQRIHTVTANDGSFNSGDIAPGGTYGQKFTLIGDYAYHCSHHAEEKGMISVKGIK